MELITQKFVYGEREQRLRRSDLNICGAKGLAPSYYVSLTVLLNH
ncbi:hypothetical protein CJBVI_0152 [Corynebacterium jeikeium]|nr:hypothetical protein CJBVI_0152 [Corynebacterium jeikeium]